MTDDKVYWFLLRGDIDGGFDVFFMVACISVLKKELYSLWTGIKGESGSFGK